MSRPTISLACIMKNEAHNLTPMLQSVRGCFDEIVLVDTGSTDNTIQFVERINSKIASNDPNWVGIPTIRLFTFPWVNDFAKARQRSFDMCTMDYICWLDLDDVLSDAGEFIRWRDTVLHSAHYWVAKYNYAFNKDGSVACEFIRERVIKRDYGFTWAYFIHEGLMQTGGKKYWPQRVSRWWVNHRRTEQDRIQDFNRNISIFESHDYDTLPPRMKFYYGKELFENGREKEAGKPLMEALKANLDIHDKLLAFQYAAQSAFSQKAYGECIDVLTNALKIAPQRAEFWVLLGDVRLTIGDHGSAAMHYKIARECKPDDLGGTTVISLPAYHEYPTTKLVEIMTMMGQTAEAEKYLSEITGTQHYEALKAKLEHMKSLGEIRSDLPKVDDIIITCPPYGAVVGWDEHTLESRGEGGSETAAIEVAKWLKAKTKLNVKIFQPRASREVMPSGVEYLPIQDLEGYLKNIEPKVHIAWRHSSKLTNAPSYVWCHDLQCQGAERAENYDKIIALSGFHKDYLIQTNGVLEEKVMLGFNGVNPDDFNGGTVQKDRLKVVFSSSPDRGLVQSIDIVKRAREMTGLDIKLHCFYGTANMRKSGHTEWADSIEAKIKENDFVVYHGMVTKKVLMNHFRQAAVWLYPADFIETYCITAIEALAAGVWPIVRDMGALKYTMKEAIEGGMCDLLGEEVTPGTLDKWAETLASAIGERKYERVSIAAQNYSWEKVADHFIEEMHI